MWLGQSLQPPLEAHGDSSAVCAMLCTGAFVNQVLPVMWLGHSLLCMVLLVSSVGMMGLHLTAYLQDPGFTPLPDAGVLVWFSVVAVGRQLAGSVAGCQVMPACGWSHMYACTTACVVHC